MALTLKALIVAACLTALLLALCAGHSPVECQEQLTVESRQQKDNDDLTDTIKYLEKLDKYFSQMARPRFGRSEFKQQAPSRFGQRQQAAAAAAAALQSAQTDPLNAAPARLGLLAMELANSRLARKYADPNY